MTEPRTVPPAPGMSAEALRRYLSEAAQRDLDALRAAVGERLQALEAALSSPDFTGSLETLIFDLARAVSAEAESATMRTALAAQLHAEERVAAAIADAGRAAADGQKTVESLRRELQQAQASLAAEREDTASVRRELDATNRALSSERQERSAGQRELEASRHEAVTAQNAADALRRELEATRAAIEDERRTSASLRNELDATRAAVDAGHAAAATAADEARRAIDAERGAAEDLQRELDKSRAAVAAERERAAGLSAELDRLREASAGDRAAGASAGREREEERTALQTERDAVASLYADIQAAERRLEAERARASTLEAELERERASTGAARDAIARLERELADVERPPAAPVPDESLTRRVAELEQALEDATSRAEEAARERDTLSAGLKASREATGADADQHQQQLAAAQARIRELEVKLFGRAREPQETDIELSPLLQAGVAPGQQPVRRATRYTFQPAPEARVAGQPAALVDLSISGAQIILAKPLEDDRTVDVELVSDETPVACQARIMWSRVERASKKQPVQYRAGLLFTNADEAAVEAFIIRYATPVKKPK